MNLKYILIAVILVVGGLFYFMHQSNKADAERLEQAKVAHEQKIRLEEAAAIQAKKDAAELKARHELQRIKENEASQKAQQDKQKAQIELAASKVKDSLLDPDSAKFRNQKGYCGEVNSKNRMGGYVGFSRYIYMPEDGLVRIESDTQSGTSSVLMDALWKIKCE